MSLKKELTASELLCRAAEYLKSAMRIHGKNITTDPMAQKCKSQKYRRDTVEFQAAAIVQAQWRRLKANVASTEIRDTLQKDIVEYMEGAMRAWCAWQRFEIERP